MEKLFIPYKTGIPVLAKEKGFNEDCLMEWKTPVAHVRDNYNKTHEVIREPNLYKDTHYGGGDSRVSYKNDLSAPLYQQITDWLREKHNINIPYVICGSNKEVLGYKWFVQVGMENQCYETKMIKDYYEGMTEAIKEALKLI